MSTCGELAQREFSRREQKKQETQERLLSAAYELFVAKGFDNTTVEEITNAAGVAKGTFFNYFASKEEMLGPMVGWRMRRFWERVESGLLAQESPLARIKLVLSEFVQTLFPDHELTQRALSLHFSRCPGHERRPLRLWRTLDDLVREAQAKGELRGDVEVPFASRLLMTCGFECIRQWSERGQPGDVAQLVDILLAGLAGPERRNM